MAVPRKLNSGGAFLSYDTYHYFHHDFSKKRKKRSAADEINLGLTIGDENHHLVLYPNYDFIAPELIFEKWEPKVQTSKKNIETLEGKRLCHYTGKVSGLPNSRVAISTCHGLVSKHINSIDK